MMGAIAKETYAVLLDELKEARQLVYKGYWVVTEGYWTMGQILDRYEKDRKIDFSYGQKTIEKLSRELGGDPTLLNRCWQAFKKYPSKEQLEKEKHRLIENGYKATWTNFREMSLPSATKHPEKYGGEELVSESILSNIEYLTQQISKVKEMYDNSSEDFKRQADGAMAKVKEVLQEVKSIPENNQYSKISRDENYLAFIRTLPCVLCDKTPSEAAHVRVAGISIKTSDYETIPLCNMHHETMHQLGVKSFAINEGLDLWHEVAKCLIKYLWG